MGSEDVRRYRVSGLLAISAAALLAVAITGTAGAAPVAQNTMVSEDPAGFTPRVVSGVAINKLVQIGSTMFAGGEFTQVRNATGQATFDRTNLFSFNATTGALTSLSVTLDGPVLAMATDGTSLWLGGEFHQVNGASWPRLVKINPTTGAVVTAFNAHLDSAVEDAQFVNGRLIVGGKFTGALRAVDPVTGDDTGYLNLGVTGTVDPGAGPTDIYQFAVDPNRTRLVAIGNFTTVGAATRYRAFMVDLGATSGTLASWYYTPLARACQSALLHAQLRDVDFSPDGSFFVIVATGYVPQAGDQGVTICDAAARFNSNVANPSRPVWMNYTGGDTLYSVAVTNAAVYIQGHQRWVSSTGVGCTPGCFAREGIAALAPATGAALTWNPGKERGVGGKDLLLTSAPAGLWVASDTDEIGNPREAHQDLAFLPLGTLAPKVASVPPSGRCAGRTATIVGTAGADHIVGTPGADVILGLAGADVIRGLGGNDAVCGGAGADRIRGGPGADQIRGGAGADRIRGGAGADRIRGGAGADRIRGGPGADQIRGGAGIDTCHSPKVAPGCNQ
jgi:Ca2+-binding RTX toxin-like protein